MKFGGQSSKNVYDIRKVCLEMCLCALVCFIEFYVLVFDEIDVIYPKVVYEHIRVRNFWETILKVQPMVLEEGPILVAKSA